jgi:hypothetical protein
LYYGAQIGQALGPKSFKEGDGDIVSEQNEGGTEHTWCVLDGIIVFVPTHGRRDRSRHSLLLTPEKP